MPRLRSSIRRKKLLRRWPAKLVLLAYIWMCCGGSLPATLLSTDQAQLAAGKDRRVPFPCMDKPCGCRDAEQCFRSCCCSTKAERIAWAKQHQVSEEYIALATVAEEKPAASTNCCASEAVSSCFQPAEKTLACGDKIVAAKKPDEQWAKPKQTPPKSRPITPSTR